jgi:hypothetical protein
MFGIGFHTHFLQASYSSLTWAWSYRYQTGTRQFTLSAKAPIGKCVSANVELDLLAFGPNGLLTVLMLDGIGCDMFYLTVIADPISF